MSHWQDTGIILEHQNFGENKKILTLFTENHGLSKGMLHVRGKKNNTLISLGNSVSCFWKARLESQLGTWKIEPVKDRSHYFLLNESYLNVLSYMCGLLSKVLPERHAYSLFYSHMVFLLENLRVNCFRSLTLFELLFLREMGFGIDLQECAVTGEREGLHWVSPKTGRCVVEAVGAPYKEKLFKLPTFLKELEKLEKNESWMSADISAEEQWLSLKITGYFIEKHFSDIPKLKDLLTLREKILIGLKKNETKADGQD